MTRDELIKLLGGAACYDSRKASEGMVNAWADAAQRGRWTYAEVVEAIKAHYAEATDFIMPAHVTKRIKAVRQDAAMRQPVNPPNPVGQAQVAKAIAGAFQTVDERAEKPWLKVLADAKRETKERRNRVLSYPDLAEQLTQPPLALSDPITWNGYIPPRTTPDGDANTSPVRQQLVAIAAEALRREGEATP